MSATPRRERGSVLIVVLWACLGLVAIALTFGHSMAMAYRGTDNDLAGRQAEAAIEGAARYAETLLADAETPGLFPDPTTYEVEAVPVGEATFWFLGRPLDTGNGTVREYGLVDEAGKLNLNTATEDMLKQLPGMTDELAAAIVEWRTAAAGGTASASTVKQGPFESVEELALLAGATWEILYGEDANLNGVLDANEDDSDRSLPADNGDGKLDPGILEYVTVFSREPSTQSDGTALVNVRQQTPPLLALFTETFGDGRGALLYNNLGGGDSNSVLEFYARSGMTEEELGQIIGKVTAAADANTPQAGLINVNTAGETVLACIPGIGTDKASELVAARLSRAAQDTNIAWIVPIIGAAAVPQAGLFVTGASWQATADVAAVGRHGRGWRRAKLVIDNSTDTPRIVYRRNLAGLGWALGGEVRESLAQNKEAR